MAKKVKVKEGHGQVVLPDGNAYVADDEVVLTEEQYDAISPKLLDAEVIEVIEDDVPGEEPSADHVHAVIDGGPP